MLAGAGATLEVRTTLEPLPPAGATLLLESGLWDIFPERDARLKAWVENGGHLVLLSAHSNSDDDAALGAAVVVRCRAASRTGPARRHAAAAAGVGGRRRSCPTSARRGRERETAQQRREREKVVRMLGAEAAPAAAAPTSRRPPPRNSRPSSPAASTAAARQRARCMRWTTSRRRWQLAGPRGTLAMRVPVGRGSVTGVAPALVIDNHDLLHGDNGLIAAAVLQAAPGRAVWIVEDEAREPLLAWLWHEARTPLLLALAAIALALWRLMVRFGPREAVPPQARRSMGEQVRGTGQFIAGTDPRALHAATRQAFEAVARRARRGLGRARRRRARRRAGRRAAPAARARPRRAAGRR